MLHGMLPFLDPKEITFQYGALTSCHKNDIILDLTSDDDAVRSRAKLFCTNKLKQELNSNIFTGDFRWLVEQYTHNVSPMALELNIILRCLALTDASNPFDSWHYYYSLNMAIESIFSIEFSQDVKTNGLFHLAIQKLMGDQRERLQMKDLKVFISKKVDQIRNVYPGVLQSKPCGIIKMWCDTAKTDVSMISMTHDRQKELARLCSKTQPW